MAQPPIDKQGVLQALTSRFPGRTEQIEQLSAIVGDGRVAATPVVVHGGPSTGKTAVVREVFASLKVPCAHISCNEHRAAKALLLSVAAQFKGRKRGHWDSGSGESRSEQVSDVLWQLPGLAPPHMPAHYIILDHAHRLASLPVLQILMRLRELTGANIGIVLLSHLAGGSGFLQHGSHNCPPAVEIAFPDYTDNQLVQILALSAPLDEVPAQDKGPMLAAYHAFLLSVVLPLVARSSRRVEDLHAVAQKMWPAYLRPVREGSAQVSERGRLHAAVRPLMQAYSQAANTDAFSGTSGSAAGPSSRSGSTLDLELPYCAKWLLLAAYVASRNRPSVDRRLFDPEHRGRRRKGQHVHDRQVETATEAAMQGPHAFPLERLLSIFWHLMRAEAEQQLSPAAELAAEVFGQIASLTCLRLLVQVSPEALEDAKYRCNVSEDLARTVARNVRFPLESYLLYT
ncbi:hypothetical protein WJX73_006476 [Symbiochloris irregularis]|uniref:Origin recognition complex subunit 5 n=1 Tax=Symbiochloris irregularis TaxID=706552 RepID=A0AAW1PNA4_9CHLO